MQGEYWSVDRIKEAINKIAINSKKSIFLINNITLHSSLGKHDPRQKKPPDRCGEQSDDRAPEHQGRGLLLITLNGLCNQNQ